MHLQRTADTSADPGMLGYLAPGRYMRIERQKAREIKHNQRPASTALSPLRNARTILAGIVGQIEFGR